MQLHPWNRGFAWRDRTGPFRSLSAEQVAAFDGDGFVVVPDLVAPDVLREAVAEIDRIEAKVDEVLRKQASGRLMIAETGAITFTTHLVTRSPALAELSRSPAIVDLCADLIGPDVNLYWDQAVYKKPEKPRRFPWHQDNGYTFVEPQQYLTIWLALTDATLENGCPQVAPGLHRARHARPPLRRAARLGVLLRPAVGEVAAPVRAGGAVVFSSLTPHLTGPNTTAAVRKAYILQYAPSGAEILRGDPAAGAARAARERGCAGAAVRRAARRRSGLGAVSRRPRGKSVPHSSAGTCSTRRRRRAGSKAGAATSRWIARRRTRSAARPRLERRRRGYSTPAGGVTACWIRMRSRAACGRPEPRGAAALRLEAPRRPGGGTRCTGPAHPPPTPPKPSPAPVRLPRRTPAERDSSRAPRARAPRGSRGARCRSAPARARRRDLPFRFTRPYSVTTYMTSVRGVVTTLPGRERSRRCGSSRTPLRS